MDIKYQHIRYLKKLECIVNKHIIKKSAREQVELKLQAAMEGTSHPAPHQPVASERQGTVSNMHLKRQI